MWCTTSLTFNNCTLCPHCIYVFCIYLRTNSDFCHLQHKLIGFYNPDEKCLQRGTDWVFKYSGLRFGFKGLICLTVMQSLRVELEVCDFVRIFCQYKFVPHSLATHLVKVFPQTLTFSILTNSLMPTNIYKFQWLQCMKFVIRTDVKVLIGKKEELSLYQYFQRCVLRNPSVPRSENKWAAMELHYITQR